MPCFYLTIFFHYRSIHEFSKYVKNKKYVSIKVTIALFCHCFSNRHPPSLELGDELNRQLNNQEKTSWLSDITHPSYQQQD